MAGRRKIEPVDESSEPGTGLAPAPRGARYTAKRRAPVEPDPEEFEAEAEAPPYAGAGDDEEEEETDEDIEGMNNPDVETFGEAPLIGGRAQTTDIYGSEAEAVGRVSSPRLYAQAAQFPTAVQFRCWKWENGIPTALGPISVEASEEDFIQRFYDAMPNKGDGRGQYRFRPVDIRGKELGKEFTITISEHHSELVRIRRQKERDREEQMGNGRQDPLIINQGNDGGGSAYAEEMGRMFEQAVGSSERRTELLQQTLEEERNRLREEEKSRYTERADLAARASDVTVKLTEKLMQTDRARSEEQIKAQASQSGMLLNTLTTVFSQQQTSAQQAAERQREADAAAAERNRLADSAKMAQDREFFERQRLEIEARRVSEREELEARRQFEKDEAERKRQIEKDEAARKHLADKDEAERKYRLQFEEWERKRTQDKEEAERRVETERQRLDLEKVRLEEQRKYELAQLQIEAQKLATEGERRRALEQMESEHRRDRDHEESLRRESEAERRRQADKEETSLRLEREKMELARAQEMAREERERWRYEMEAKRLAEKEEWERKRIQEKEDAERRERSDRERLERERADFQLRMEREKQEAERSEARRREEMELARQDFLMRIEKEKSETERASAARREDMQREADRRRDEIALQQKQMDISAQRDREHAVHLMEMAKLEREAAREAQSTREKQERDARESAERERQRQMEFALKQLEADKQAQREHAERLHQANKAQAVGGFGSLAETLGMETPELLARIYGGNQREDDGEDKGSGWADAIPKVLGTIAEFGAVAMKAKAEASHAEQRGRRQLPDNVQIVQTPNGPQMLLPGNAMGIPMARQPVRQPQQQQVRPSLPDQPHLPPEFANEDENPGQPQPQGHTPAPQSPNQQGHTPAQSPPSPASETEPAVEPEAAPVNTLARAKAAGLSLLDQRKARKALRKLTEKLSEADQDDWLGIVTESIGANLGIYHYIKAVSVRAALAEITPDTEFHTKVVDMMKNSGMIPDDVPYDEADYARLHGDK